MRQLLVFGHKTFKITIPDDARVTFGPWSPPPAKGNFTPPDGQWSKGTLRVYKGKTEKDGILACFSQVMGFRDLSLSYAEEVAREEGSVIWKDDEHGYVREDKVRRAREWVDTPALPDAAPPRRRRR